MFFLLQYWFAKKKADSALCETVWNELRKEISCKAWDSSLKKVGDLAESLYERQMKLQKEVLKFRTKKRILKMISSISFLFLFRLIFLYILLIGLQSAVCLTSITCRLLTHICSQWPKIMFQKTKNHGSAMCAPWEENKKWGALAFLLSMSITIIQTVIDLMIKII
jgi:hypothetical protein